MGMPLVLRPKTLPMVMFQPKCHPSANPRRPPVSMTLRPAAIPPTKMLSMLWNLDPPGDCKCMVTKKPDSVSTARKMAKRGGAEKWAAKASAKLCSIHPRSGSSSFSATFRWKTTSQKMQAAKPSDGSSTSKHRRKLIQPNANSAAKMKNTIPNPTANPADMSTIKAPSNASPIDANERPSRHRHVKQTTRRDAKFMPTRMQASLHRCRPETWLRKKGCPGFEARARSSPLSRCAGGQGSLGSLTASSSRVGSQAALAVSPQSHRPSCSSKVTKSSVAAACATMKKTNRGRMCIFPSADEWNTSAVDAA
mmetsp:Transcript_71169/g.189239  ORF Transcript_71169/g.189239 Transcript_71169/m.189239 type:complete len:309 (-) Transcript_71169:143-1069(-)